MTSNFYQKYKERLQKEAHEKYQHFSEEVKKCRKKLEIID